MFKKKKKIQSSVNIPSTEIIIVSKQILTQGEYKKNNVLLWPEIYKHLKFVRVYKRLVTVRCEPVRH